MAPFDRVIWPPGNSGMKRFRNGQERQSGTIRRDPAGVRSGGIALVFVPQSYQWGQEAQVDWLEATAKLGGEPIVLQFFAMRSMASGDAFHRAYTNATQQVFLEAHQLAFAYFEGVFRTLRYDNLKC